jgi:hypothetical protein
MLSDAKTVCDLVKGKLLRLLSDHQDSNWVETCIAEIDDILKGTTTSDVLSCSCPHCIDGRKSAISENTDSENTDSENTDSENTDILSSLGRFRRLFATCIIADRPFLIYLLHRHDVDDNRFDDYITESDLTRECRLSLEDAKTLLLWKEAFFDGGRIKLITYIRSTRQRDRPSTDEKIWIINELLSLLKKLTLEPHAQARKLPATARIGDIMIRDSPVRFRVLTGAAIPELEGRSVCMQSLGYLILDILWFVAGGGHCVLDLDNHRTPGADWVKETNWRSLNQFPDLSKAFQLAWFMICFNEDFRLSQNSEGKNYFQHISTQFQRIWPDITDHLITDPLVERSPEIMRQLSQGSGSQGDSSYIEIEPETFRWM